MTQDAKGFTLIEIIAALVLVGILATGGTYAISKAVEAYMFTQKNASMAQKTQAAIDRMIVDFTYIDKTATEGETNGPTSFTYVGDYPEFPQNVADAPVSETHTIVQSGENIMYDGQILLDNVKAGSLDISYLTIGGVDDGTFTADTVIVNVAFTVNIANDQEVDYAMQAVVGKDTGVTAYTGP